MNLTELKDLAETVSSFVTVAALSVGGLWTYLLFVKNREKYPRASVSHHVSSFLLARDTRVVRVAVRVKNAGKVLLPISELQCRLLQVLPPAGGIEAKLEHPTTLIEKGRQRISWPMIDDRVWRYEKGQAELEPEETETFWCDFVITHSVQAVQVYSHLRNTSKNVIGWSCITQCTFSDQEPNDASTSSAT